MDFTAAKKGRSVAKQNVKKGPPSLQGCTAWIGSRALKRASRTARAHKDTTFEVSKGRKQTSRLVQRAWKQGHVCVECQGYFSRLWGVQPSSFWRSGCNRVRKCRKSVPCGELGVGQR